jgi:hypothetical protein
LAQIAQAGLLHSNENKQESLSYNFGKAKVLTFDRSYANKR